MGAIIVATTRVVTTRSLERTSSDLEAARTAFERLADDRAEFASAQAALVTALPVFRAHMNDVRLAQDAATLTALVDEYRRQLKADFAIVGDRGGRWTAESGWPGGLPAPSGVSTAIASATAGRPARTIVAQPDRLYLLVSEPARFADEVLGTLTVGFALDDAVVKRLAGVTHTEVNLVAAGRLYASSLTGARHTALAAAVMEGGWPTDRAAGSSPEYIQHIGDGQYAAGVYPLPSYTSGGVDGHLVLLQDWRPTQAFVDEIQRRLLGAGAVIFVVAVGGGLMFSRRMSQPVRDLAAAAGDIAGGNWTRQLPVRGSAEAMMMAQAVNDMTSNLRQSFETVKTRDDQLRQAQKLEALGRLAGGVAHDFNNLLTAIKGYADLLIDAIEEGDQRRGDAQEIIKAADRAASLTRQLLAFSRRQVVAIQVLSPGRVVAGTESMLRRLIGEDIEFITSVAPDTWRVSADPNQIEQVLLNLVVNARDAMPTGGTLRIDLSNVEFGGPAGSTHMRLAAGRYVRLSVSDTGCGMTDEVKARIFEPFYTTKAEGRGTGLGLSMVYGLVEQLGGAIDVDTEVNRGTTFHIYIPRTEAEEPVATSPAGAPRPRGTETVLLVEDEPGIAGLIASTLRKTGYVVLAASRGQEALDVAGAYDGPIDLLLTDVVMPGMNGRELASHLTEARRETRVLYMSGYSDDALLRHGVQTSAAHFIQKPFSLDTLAGKIRETLGAPLDHSGDH